MKKRILISGAVAVLLASILVACVGGSFFPGSAAVVYPTVPKFVIGVDGGLLGANARPRPNGGGTSFANVNVFPVNATTGVLGAAITGSPFDLGLTDGMTLAVHPNGHFVYAADGIDGSIHAWDVNETTGTPTQVGTPTINESGTFYEPCCGQGDAPTHVITITPSGNFLYSANNDATVGAYKINADGSLAHIADVTTTACDTGAITANDTYVWVTDTCGNAGPWNIFTLKIGASGALTSSSSVALTGVDSWLWSIQLNPTGKFLYSGDEGGAAQIFGFSVAADGSLTQLGPQFGESSSSDCRDMYHSPDGKFLYTTDDEEEVHAIGVDITTGALTELGASPYSPGGEGQIVVDVTGTFVFMGDQENTGQIIGYTRDMTTGALTLIGGTTTAGGTARAIAIIR